ncbi:hypothetical protein MACH24_31670 [Erythrobacter sp. Dej080120_24]|nr:hypothetical protein MACH24_31670 [Erythrobacter sp. Dej080120_24]
MTDINVSGIAKSEHIPHGFLEAQKERFLPNCWAFIISFRQSITPVNAREEPIIGIGQRWQVRPAVGEVIHEIEDRLGARPRLQWAKRPYISNRGIFFMASALAASEGLP